MTLSFVFSLAMGLSPGSPGFHTWSVLSLGPQKALFLGQHVCPQDPAGPLLPTTYTQGCWVRQQPFQCPAVMDKREMAPGTASLQMQEMQNWDHLPEGTCKDKRPQVSISITWKAPPDAEHQHRCLGCRSSSLQIFRFFKNDGE